MLSETLPSSQQRGLQVTGESPMLSKKPRLALITPIPCAAQPWVPETRTATPAQAHSLSLATKLHVMEQRKLCFLIWERHREKTSRVPRHTPECDGLTPTPLPEQHTQLSGTADTISSSSCPSPASQRCSSLLCSHVPLTPQPRTRVCAHLHLHACSHTQTVSSPCWVWEILISFPPAIFRLAEQI